MCVVNSEIGQIKSIHRYQSGVTVSPDNHAMRLAVSTSGTRLVLKFCEADFLALPRGIQL